MNITYFNRNNKSGYSIAKVFEPIINNINQKNEVNSFFVPYNGTNIVKILKNIYYVNRRRNKKGINHITGDIHYCILGLIGCKTILTIHDIGFINSPVNKHNAFSRLQWYLIWLLIPALLANKINTISLSIYKELLIILPKFLHNKISIINNPIDLDKVKFTPKNEINTVPIILHIGTKTNKNLERVIEGISNIHCILVIIGRLNVNQINLLNSYKIDYINEWNLSDIQLYNWYIKCDIVSFPSLYEGFGMPIIEGQAIGRPVVTSNIEPMPHVGGDGAIYVNPFSVDSIKRGFTNILQSKDLYQSIVLKGIKNVERFSINNISNQYYHLYNRII